MVLLPFFDVSLIMTGVHLIILDAELKYNIVGCDESSDSYFGYCLRQQLLLRLGQNRLIQQVLFFLHWFEIYSFGTES